MIPCYDPRRERVAVPDYAFNVTTPLGFDVHCTSGFLVTAYPTDSMKIGESIWRKSE
jgi:hypothetical protein